MNRSGSGIPSYVARTRSIVDAAPPTSSDETRTWIVDPLLETLGWDLRSDVRVGPGADVAGVHLEYALGVDRTPALFVALESVTDSLSDQREDDLRRAMTTIGVDRAIYTNGRTVVLLATADSGGDVDTGRGTGTATGGRTDAFPDDGVSVERFQCSLSSLESATEQLEHVSRSRLDERLDPRARSVAARRLAIDRDELASAILEELAAVAGQSHQPELETATDEFLEDVLDRFRSESRTSTPDHIPDPDERDRIDDGSSAVESSTSARSGDSSRDSDVDSADITGTADADAHAESPTLGTDASAGVYDETSVADDRVDRDETTTEDDTATGDEPATVNETGGEYVVRFFNDRGSIGAIGHSRSDRSMTHAAEFLFQRGLSGIRVPWSPDDDVAVVNDDPVLADGTPMERFHRLSNGYYLNTSGPLERRAARIEALSDRAGLRAMLTGDWAENGRP